MAISIEDIPDPDELVRLLRENEIEKHGEQIIPSLHAFYDKNLSVDWLVKTTIGDCYNRLPKSTAHVTFIAGDLRALDEVVRHDPTDENPAHALVLSKSQSKDRPKAVILFFIHKMRQVARRPLSCVSNPQSSEAGSVGSSL